MILKGFYADYPPRVAGEGLGSGILIILIGLGPIAFMLLLNALTSAAEEQPYWEYLFDRGLIHLVIWGGFGLFMIALGLRAIIKGIRAGRLRALDIQGKGSAPLR